MAQTRTAKGTNRSGSTDDTISIVDVAGVVGQSFVIAIMGDGASPTSVYWGSGSDRQDAIKLNSESVNTTAGINLSLWIIKYLHSSLTQTLTADWAATNSERAIMCTMLDECTVLDVYSTNDDQDSTGAPNTGTSVNTTEADTFHLAFFLSDGRASDTYGTLGDGHTAGQRASTVPAGVDLRETYEDLSIIGGCRSSISGATSRNWCAIVVALHKRQTFTVKSVVQYNRNVNQNPDHIWVVIEDESGAGFTTKLDPFFFDAMTDTDFVNYLRRICSIYTSNNLDSEYEADPDTARDIRMATFVNDEIVI